MKEVQKTGSLYLMRDELLNSYSGWGTQVKADLQSQTDDIDLAPLIMTMMECLSRIATIVIKDDLPELVRSANVITLMLGSIDLSLGTPAIIRQKPSDDLKNGIDTYFEWIPLHRVQKLAHIIRMAQTKSSSENPGAPGDEQRAQSSPD